jgi:hypothetical protein
MTQSACAQTRREGPRLGARCVSTRTCNTAGVAEPHQRTVHTDAPQPDSPTPAALPQAPARTARSLRRVGAVAGEHPAPHRKGRLCAATRLSCLGCASLCLSLTHPQCMSKRGCECRVATLLGATSPGSDGSPMSTALSHRDMPAMHRYSGAAWRCIQARRSVDRAMGGRLRRSFGTAVQANAANAHTRRLRVGSAPSPCAATVCGEASARAPRTPPAGFHCPGTRGGGVSSRGRMGAAATKALSDDTSGRWVCPCLSSKRASAQALARQSIMPHGCAGNTARTPLALCRSHAC